MNEGAAPVRGSSSGEPVYAVDAVRIGSWEWDVVADRVTADPTFAALYGVDATTAMTGAPLSAFFGNVHPDDIPRVRKQIALALKQGGPFDADYRLCRPNGRAVWVSARGFCHHDDAGRPVRFPGVSFDIDMDRRAADRMAALVKLGDELRQPGDPADLAFASARLLGETLEVSRAGYGTIDAASETILIERDWNAPDIASIAGTLHFRDYGTYIRDLKRGDTVAVGDAYDDPRTVDTADALSAISARSFVNMPITEQADFVAIIFVNCAGPRAWTEDEITFIRDVGERTRDAVERRRAEAELAALNARLEAEVEARTNELLVAEDSLRQAQKMEAVGQLTGGLAHDFNNLLTGITGAIEMMQVRIKQGRTGDLDRYAAAAQGAAKRAAALTHRLLAFSRRQTLDPRPTDINRLVQGMEDMIRRTVGPEINVEFVGATGLWTAMVDGNQLENALLNLCINARDAMPDGGRITIETANKWLDERAAKVRDLEPGQYLSLCVTDTGTGMAPEVQARAFDPFYTTKPMGEGTGLGLSMIYGFARQSGGQARIYSELGTGTTMCIYLPRLYDDAEGKGDDKASAAPVIVTGPRTVLVVDDEPTIRMLVIEILEEMGHTVLEAGDGAAALRVLHTGARIDLLVTDIGLPGSMNGRQVADAALALLPKLKILFITGYAENAVIGNRQLEPNMALVTKPFAMDTLSQRIAAMIEAGDE
ncbi:MAG: PAS domain-containing protein [Sphingomonas bacterium]|nr:PAS domain-containing protein [Sphingomonas bacterium]